jgi:hypothetical protein
MCGNAEVNRVTGRVAGRADGIDIEQQGGRAALVGRLWIEDVRRSE